jgi:hypothetical protein
MLVREPIKVTIVQLIGQRLSRTKSSEGAACEVVVTTGRITDFIGTQPRPTRFRRSSPKAGTVRCRPSTRRS